MAGVRKNRRITKQDLLQKAVRKATHYPASGPVQLDVAKSRGSSYDKTIMGRSSYMGGSTQLDHVMQRSISNNSGSSWEPRCYQRGARRGQAYESGFEDSSGYPSSWNLDVARPELEAVAHPVDELGQSKLIKIKPLSRPTHPHTKIDTAIQCKIPRRSTKPGQKLTKIISQAIIEIKGRDGPYSTLPFRRTNMHRVFSGGLDDIQNTATSNRPSHNYGGYTPSECSCGSKAFTSRSSNRLHHIEKISSPPAGTEQQKLMDKFQLAKEKCTRVSCASANKSKASGSHSCFCKLSEALLEDGWVNGDAEDALEPQMKRDQMDAYEEDEEMTEQQWNRRQLEELEMDEEQANRQQVEDYQGRDSQLDECEMDELPRDGYQEREQDQVRGQQMEDDQMEEYKREGSQTRRQEMEEYQKESNQIRRQEMEEYQREGSQIKRQDVDRPQREAQQLNILVKIENPYGEVTEDNKGYLKCPPHGYASGMTTCTCQCPNCLGIRTAAQDNVQAKGLETLQNENDASDGAFIGQSRRGPQAQETGLDTDQEGRHAFNDLQSESRRSTAAASPRQTETLPTERESQKMFGESRRSTAQSSPRQPSTQQAEWVTPPKAFEDSYCQDPSPRSRQSNKAQPQNSSRRSTAESSLHSPRQPLIQQAGWGSPKAAEDSYGQDSDPSPRSRQSYKAQPQDSSRRSTAESSLHNPKQPLTQQAGWRSPKAAEDSYGQDSDPSPRSRQSYKAQPQDSSRRSTAESSLHSPRQFSNSKRATNETDPRQSANQQSRRSASPEAFQYDSPRQSTPFNPRQGSTRASNPQAGNRESVRDSIKPQTDNGLSPRSTIQLSRRQAHSRGCPRSTCRSPSPDCGLCSRNAQSNQGCTCYCNYCLVPCCPRPCLAKSQPAPRANLESEEEPEVEPELEVPGRRAANPITKEAQNWKGTESPRKEPVSRWSKGKSKSPPDSSFGSKYNSTPETKRRPESKLDTKEEAKRGSALESPSQSRTGSAMELRKQSKRGSALQSPRRSKPKSTLESREESRKASPAATTRRSKPGSTLESREEPRRASPTASTRRSKPESTQESTRQRESLQEPTRRPGSALESREGSKRGSSPEPPRRPKPGSTLVSRERTKKESPEESTRQSKPGSTLETKSASAAESKRQRGSVQEARAGSKKMATQNPSEGFKKGSLLESKSGSASPRVSYKHPVASTKRMENEPKDHSDEDPRKSKTSFSKIVVTQEKSRQQDCVEVCPNCGFDLRHALKEVARNASSTESVSDHLSTRHDSKGQISLDSRQSVPIDEDIRNNVRDSYDIKKFSEQSRETENEECPCFSECTICYEIMKKRELQKGGADWYFRQNRKCDIIPAKVKAGDSLVRLIVDETCNVTEVIEILQETVSQLKGQRNPLKPFVVYPGVAQDQNSINTENNMPPTEEPSQRNWVTWTNPNKEHVKMASKTFSHNRNEYQKSPRMRHMATNTEETAPPTKTIRQYEREIQPEFQSQKVDRECSGRSQPEPNDHYSGTSPDMTPRQPFNTTLASSRNRAQLQLCKERKSYRSGMNYAGNALAELEEKQLRKAYRTANPTQQSSYFDQGHTVPSLGQIIYFAEEKNPNYELLETKMETDSFNGNFYEGDYKFNHLPFQVQRYSDSVLHFGRQGKDRMDQEQELHPCHGRQGHYDPQRMEVLLPPPTRRGREISGFDRKILLQRARHQSFEACYGYDSHRRHPKRSEADLRLSRKSKFINRSRKTISSKPSYMQSTEASRKKAELVNPKLDSLSNNHIELKRSRSKYLKLTQNREQFGMDDSVLSLRSDSDLRNSKLISQQLSRRTCHVKGPEMRRNPKRTDSRSSELTRKRTRILNEVSVAQKPKLSESKEEIKESDILPIDNGLIKNNESERLDRSKSKINTFPLKSGKDEAERSDHSVSKKALSKFKFIAQSKLIESNPSLAKTIASARNAAELMLAEKKTQLKSVKLNENETIPEAEKGVERSEGSQSVSAAKQTVSARRSSGEEKKQQETSQNEVPIAPLTPVVKKAQIRSNGLSSHKQSRGSQTTQKVESKSDGIKIIFDSRHKFSRHSHRTDDSGADSDASFESRASIKSLPSASQNDFFCMIKARGKCSDK